MTFGTLSIQDVCLPKLLEEPMLFDLVPKFSDGGSATLGITQQGVSGEQSLRSLARRAVER